jgi:hypothetical protein
MLAAAVEFVDETDQHVNSRTRPDAWCRSQLSIEFPTRLVFEFEERQQFTKPPRGDARTVQRLTATQFQTRQFADRRSGSETNEGEGAAATSNGIVTTQ